MKIAIIIGSVLALAGVFVGLLYLHVVKADKLAKSSPAIASLLKSMGLYNPRKSVAPAATASIPPGPPPDFTAEKQALEVEKSQLQAERSAAQKQAAAPPTPSLAVEMSAPQSPKLVDIYNTMGPDDLAKIFEKQSDPEVVRSLAAMDERKAGKVLAAIPPDRAAKLTMLLSRMPQPGDASTTQGAASDAVAPTIPAAPQNPNIPTSQPTTIAQAQ